MDFLKKFGHLSRVTGLDGGNLRFHLKKLKESGLIIQHSKGGEYIISEKGRIVVDYLLTSLLNL